MEYTYDLFIIGAGPSGYAAALKASQLGMKVVLAEAENLGGTCLNNGCIPTKALLYSAKLLREVRLWPSLGLSVSNVGFNYSAMHARKDEIIIRLREDIANMLDKVNVTVLHGRAQIIGPHCVRLGGKRYRAERILVATGSLPFKPPINGSDLPNVVTSNDLLSKELFYQRLVIIGGGVVGLEFAALFNALGCEVSVIEAMGRILPAIDRELSQRLTNIMIKRGVKIYCGSMVNNIEQLTDGCCCNFTSRGEKCSVVADGILVATGRRGNIDELFYKVTPNIEYGFLKVDKNFCTNIESIYAVGDVTYGSRHLAHAASTEAVNAICRMAGKEPPLDLRYITSCIFTDPEIATVGLSADEARAEGIEATTGTYVMSHNEKSLIEQHEEGYIKIVAEMKSGRLLGAQLICCHATDLINELALAVTKGLTARDLAQVIRPHPTMGEGIAEAAEMIYDQALRILPHH